MLSKNKAAIANLKWKTITKIVKQDKTTHPQTKLHFTCANYTWWQPPVWCFMSWKASEDRC